MIKSLIKNPFTIWLVWLLKSRKLMWVNRKKNLKIGYLAKVEECQFGTFNTIYEEAILSNCKIGNYVYIAHQTKIIHCKIGSFCSIGPNVKIGLGMHPTNFKSTFPAFFSLNKQCQITFCKQNIYNEYGNNIIGNDVWIGANSIILDNVEIGDGAIVAAGSVVTKNVAPYTIVGGVPAKVIKKRFSEATIQELIHSKWWDQEISLIIKNIEKFQSPLK